MTEQTNREKALARMMENLDGQAIVYAILDLADAVRELKGSGECRPCQCRECTKP